MSRARIEGDALVFDDPVRNMRVEIYVMEGDACISPPPGQGCSIWIRRSDAASVGDWLRRTFDAPDWRIGADPAHTSIPREDLREQLRNMTSAATAATHTAEVACRRLEAQQPIMNALEQWYDRGISHHEELAGVIEAWEKYIASGTKPT